MGRSNASAASISSGRIVAATHRDLQAMVAAGTFREDLWYRIAVFPIRLPSLRERPEDIPGLATHFAIKAARRFGTAVRISTPEDLRLLLAYSRPGNVRELASVIERATILGNGTRLDGVGRTRGDQSERCRPDEPLLGPRARWWRAGAARSPASTLRWRSTSAPRCDAPGAGSKDRAVRRSCWTSTRTRCALACANCASTGARSVQARLKGSPPG